MRPYNSGYYIHTGYRIYLFGSDEMVGADQKKKEIGFGELVRRLFEPVGSIKKQYIFFLLSVSNWFVIDFFIVFFGDKIGNSIDNGDIERIKWYVIRFFIVFIVTYIVKYLARTKGPELVRYDVAKVLRNQGYDYFFKMSVNETEKIGTGKIMKIIDTGIQRWIEVLQEVGILMTELVFKTIIILFVLVRLGWRTVIVYSILLCIIIWATNKIFVQKVAILRIKRREKGIENNRQFVKMIMSKIEIIQNSKLFQEKLHYSDGLEKQKELSFKTMKWVFWMFNIPLIVVHLFYGFSLVYVLVSFTQGSFDFGTFVSLSLASATLGPFMLKITDGYKNILDSFIEIEKLREFYDTTPQMKNYETGVKFELREGGVIELKDVGFTYTQGSNVFSDFSLAIEQGKKTALVGMSGSGKSTLIKLIAGYLMPDEGKVLVDGQDLTTVALQSYFAHIGYLTQEPSVFDGTIRENLEYGMIEGSKDTTKLLDQAVRLAKCDFIDDLPNGLDTEIGERGIRLSGGQRQRLAIAKIFLKDPKIVLLDEPTSALDSFAEEAVTEAMENLFKGRTVIIIAHRLQTVKHADDIIVIDHGKVIERGTHDELVSKGGYYARMLELQSGF